MLYRRIAIKRIYPDLIHGPDDDYHVLNRQTDGGETIIWSNEETQPTEVEMQMAYDAVMVDKENEQAITAKMAEISDRELRVKAIAEIESENVAEK